MCRRYRRTTTAKDIQFIAGERSAGVQYNPSLEALARSQ